MFFRARGHPEGAPQKVNPTAVPCFCIATVTLLSFSKSHSLKLLGNVGKYCDKRGCLRLQWGRLFCLPGLLPLPLFLMAGGSLTARIPPLTSAIMRAQTGIDLQNDGLTMGQEPGLQTSPEISRWGLKRSI